MMALIAERLLAAMTGNRMFEGLTSQQRAEIFRRQMLVERDRLEAMHASLHVFSRDDFPDPENALDLRLRASELAASDGIAKGIVDDFLVATSFIGDDDTPIEAMLWSDLAESIADGGAEAEAVARLGDIGVEQTELRAAMARKVVHQARIAAIAEFREALLNPAASYPSVPLPTYLGEAHSVPAGQACTPPALRAMAGPWAKMTPTQAVEKFFEQNPRTGGSDGTRRRKGSKPWTAKTREQFRLPALLLEQVMHGRALATVTHDDLVKLDECFSKLHGPSFRKSEGQRAMTIWEIVKETENAIIPDEAAGGRGSRRDNSGRGGGIRRDELGLGLSTTNRHWGFLRQLTRWFNDHHPLAKLDYAAFIEGDRRDARDQRDRYTEEEGRLLFQLPPWTGAASASKRMNSGAQVIHDSWYWVPMILWYTGARRAEICGLRIDEITCVEGKWCFDIVENDARRLKTVRSKRVIPIGDELLRLGLLEYVSALREGGETALFPELVMESGKGNMGDTFYKNCWTKISKALPFLEPGQAMQSFRHTAIDELKGGEISAELRADLAGHRMSSQTEDRYSKAHLDLISKAIATIPKVTNELDPVPITLLPKRLRAPRKARPAKLASIE
jgi:integrase